MEFRILIVDDSPDIHEDFKRTLISRPSIEPPAAVAKLLSLDEASEPAATKSNYCIDHAYSGEEALRMVADALTQDRPYALAFIDVRMPPGMDGITTLSALWEIDPVLEAVICTAYSDYSWEQIAENFPAIHRLLVLKKPFDTIEVKQLALCLTHKWVQERENRQYLETLAKEKQDLEEARNKAEESNRVKSDFMAIVSHELKTPLTAILGYVSLMMSMPEPKLPKIHQDSCERVNLNARKLHDLIRDILFISEIESGEMQCKGRVFCPKKIISGVLDTMKPLIDEKGLQINFEAEEKIPEIFTDMMKFEIIISNLLSNAVKFTHSGSIDIKMRQIDEDIECTVSDTGIGIDPKNFNLVFEKFRQVDESITRHYRGTGLGLAIVKRMVNMLGGSVTLQSKLGEGSTFCIRAKRDLKVLGLIDY